MSLLLVMKGISFETAPYCARLFTCWVDDGPSRHDLSAQGAASYQRASSAKTVQGKLYAEWSGLLAMRAYNRRPSWYRARQRRAFVSFGRCHSCGSRPLSRGDRARQIRRAWTYLCDRAGSGRPKYQLYVDRRRGRLRCTPGLHPFADRRRMSCRSRTPTSVNVVGREPERLHSSLSPQVASSIHPS